MRTRGPAPHSPASQRTTCHVQRRQSSLPLPIAALARRKEWNETSSRKIQKYVEGIFSKSFVYVRPDEAGEGRGF